jgi:RHS repeat-associated protein
MPHLPLMQWDFHDQLQATARQVVGNGGTPETTWYVYDGSGERVRKVTERQTGAGQIPTRKTERVYLGGFEIYREYANDGSTIDLERETLHVMDDKQRIALVETRTQGSDGSSAQLARYQLSNHLGSAILELDNQAQIISYEEYFPYGSTSYQAVRSRQEAPKRYRYTGMERDEESGLQHHDARLYLPSLGRWSSPDPGGMIDGPCVYCYCKANPIKFTDTDGSKAKDPPAPGIPVEFDKSARRALGLTKQSAKTTVPAFLKTMFNQEYGIDVKMVDGRLTYAGDVTTSLTVSPTAKEMWKTLLTTNSPHSLSFTANSTAVDLGQNTPVAEAGRNAVPPTNTEVDLGDFDLTQATMPTLDRYSNLEPRAFNLGRVLEHEVLGHGVKGYSDAYDKSKNPDNHGYFQSDIMGGDTVDFANTLAKEMGIATRNIYGGPAGRPFDQGGVMIQMGQLTFTNPDGSRGIVTVTNGADLKLTSDADWMKNMKNSEFGKSKPRYQGLFKRKR